VAQSAGALPTPAAAVAVPQASAVDMLRPPILQRMIVGSWVLITINTLIFGFVIFLPQFFLRQGLTITNSWRMSRLRRLEIVMSSLSLFWTKVRCSAAQREKHN
jgi:hypothetical protein